MKHIEKSMRSVPVGPEQFSEFIDQAKIFDRTRELMREYLANWYYDDAEAFAENMRADLSIVLEQYHFHNEFVSITKNFNFDPPADTISCTIRITDEENDCCARYSAIFDFQLNAIDDYMGG